MVKPAGGRGRRSDPAVYPRHGRDPRDRRTRASMRGIAVVRKSPRDAGVQVGAVKSRGLLGAGGGPAIGR